MTEIVIQEPTVELTINGTRVPCTDVRVETNRYNEADMMKATVLVDDPPMNAPVSLSVSGNPVFGGRIWSESDYQDGRNEIKAFNIIKYLKQQTVTASFEDASLLQIVKSSMYMADVSTRYYNLDLPEIRTSIKFDDDPVTTILDQVARSGNILWWVDGRDVLNVRQIDEGDVTTYHAQHVKNASAGKRAPPYNSVVVWGSSATDKYGRDYQHMPSRNNVFSMAGDGDPTYRYSSNAIKTAEQASNVASKLLNDFKEQQASGYVDVVGVGVNYTLFDVLKMPEEYGGERYLIKGMIHKFNNDDGLVSRIQCGGLMDGVPDNQEPQTCEIPESAPEDGPSDSSSGSDDSYDLKGGGTIATNVGSMYAPSP